MSVNGLYPANGSIKGIDKVFIPRISWSAFIAADHRKLDIDAKRRFIEAHQPKNASTIVARPPFPFVDDANQQANMIGLIKQKELREALERRQLLIMQGEAALSQSDRCSVEIGHVRQSKKEADTTRPSGAASLSEANTSVYRPTPYHHQLMTSNEDEDEEEDGTAVTTSATCTDDPSAYSSSEASRYSAFSNQEVLKMYRGGGQSNNNGSDAAPWGMTMPIEHGHPPTMPPPPFPPPSSQQQRQTALLSTAHLVDADKSVASTNLHRPTAMFSQHALAPHPSYPALVNNDGIILNTTTTTATTGSAAAAPQMMRISVENVVSRLESVLGAAASFSSTCAYPVTPGERYVLRRVSIEDRDDIPHDHGADHGDHTTEVLVLRFFNGPLCGLGRIASSSKCNNDNEDEAAQSSATAIASEWVLLYKGNDSVQAALGARSLFPIQDVAVGQLSVMAPAVGVQSTAMLYTMMSIPGPLLPLNDFMDELSSPRNNVSVMDVKATKLNIFKLLLKTLQKLVVRRVVHGNLDIIHNWMVGMHPQSRNLFLLPIHWHSVIDFSMFVDSQIGVSIPCCVADGTMPLKPLHYGYDIATSLPAMILLLDEMKTAWLQDESQRGKLLQLAEWCSQGGHSSHEYGLRLNDCIALFATVVNVAPEGVVFPSHC